MTYSRAFFSKKLGFVSLMVLAAQLACPVVNAMDPMREDENEKIVFKTKNKLCMKDVDRYVRKANKGDKQAQDSLMDIYYQRGYEDFISEGINFSKWDKIVQRCCDQDNYAYFVISEFEILDEDFLKSFPDIHAGLEARKEDPRALYNRGFMYANGLGVPQDISLALKYFRDGAKKEHAPSQYMLGVLYQNKMVVDDDIIGDDEKTHTKNWNLSFHYMKLAAAQGYIPALYAYGTKILNKYKNYWDSPGDAHFKNFCSKISLNEETSDDLLKKNCPEYPIEVYHYLRYAADQGYALALGAMSHFYQDAGDKGKLSDYEKRAKNLGHSVQKNRCPEDKYNNLRFAIEEYESYHDWRCLADQGDIKALYELGEYYLKNHALYKIVKSENLHYRCYNADEAFFLAQRYYWQAAEKEYPQALYMRDKASFAALPQDSIQQILSIGDIDSHFFTPQTYYRYLLVSKAWNETIRKVTKKILGRIQTDCLIQDNEPTYQIGKLLDKSILTVDLHVSYLNLRDLESENTLKTFLQEASWCYRRISLSKDRRGEESSLKGFLDKTQEVIKWNELKSLSIRSSASQVSCSPKLARLCSQVVLKGSSLVRLAFRSMNMTPEQMTAIIKNLPQTLKLLDLVRSNCGNGGCNALREKLPTLTNLQLLFLGHYKNGSEYNQFYNDNTDRSPFDYYENGKNSDRKKVLEGTDVIHQAVVDQFTTTAKEKFPALEFFIWR